ncbi:MAG: trypsin-like peptidase domain-containing protein [Chloroflexi bacterium]|nr:trypsin-like peptidase domain-containing protein [Chloroflexota bacterium]
MKRINIKYLIVNLSLVLSLALAAGCAVAPSKVETSPPSNTATPAKSELSTPAPKNEALPVISTSQAAPLPSIADVVAKVKPSVVAINISIPGYDPFTGSFSQEGAGSGWIIRKDGIIVTNNHVVENADNITVTLDDSQTFQVDMKTVATDPLTDLAILKINAKNLPAVTVGDSRKLRLGDWVVAIGNSLDLCISPSAGIVRSLRASVPVSAGQTLYNLIGTTAPINPGNSGGPLVNMAGEVVGITSAKISAAGVEGMGYAISSQDAMPIIQALINTGYVVRPYLGATLYPVDPSVVFWYRLAVDKGAFVASVAAGSPADKAGLKARDVITKFDNQEITDANQLLTILNSAQAGQKVTITFWRGKTERTIPVTIIESPPPSPP